MRATLFMNWKAVSMFKRHRAIIGLAAFLLCLENSAQAETSTKATASFFRQAALDDVEAAWRVLRDNHPGAAPELQDTTFQATLASALAIARQRAAQVSTPSGYLATLAGFSNSFGDAHIRVAPQFLDASPTWVGLIRGYRNGSWVVVDEDLWRGRESLRGATLTSCDGRDIQDVAQERLGGFRAHWPIEAQRGTSAPWLLVDEHNPFVQPLKRCEFNFNGRVVTVDMDWTAIARDKLGSRLRQASGIGAAGWGVRPVGNGWWIALQELTANAPAVVAAAQAHQSQLRASSFVVLDLRGNGGGSSDYGSQLASVLYGSRADGFNNEQNACREAWRVSPDNQARLEAYPHLMGERLSAEENARIQDDIAAMKQAASTKQDFSRPTQCRLQPKVLPPPSGADPFVYVLTDRACFSSCLIVVRDFLKLGAILVGESTNGDTRYQENRDVLLPSGLAAVGTQAAVDPTSPPFIGPFVPQFSFEGDLRNTPSVEDWVVDLHNRLHR
jgi:hypothetical protein